MHKALCSALFLLWVALPLAAPAGDRMVVEEIVARVNNEIITLTELEQSRQQLRRELSQRFRGAAFEQKFKEEEANLLRDLIDQSLLVQRGNDLGFSVEADVIKRMDRIRQDMGLGTMEELERAIRAQGQNPEDFRQQLREQILTNVVVQREVSGKVMISRDEARAYYNQHRQELNRPERIHLREILVSTEGVPPQSREERVQEVLAKIRSGEKFEELAQTYSDAPTGADGGDLGYFEKDKLAPHIQEAIANLREGGVADPLLTPQGWLILQLAEHVPEGIPSFEKVEQELTAKIYYDRVQPALREYLSGLRRDAFLYIKPGYLDTGAVEDDTSQRPKRRRRSLRDRKKRDN